MTYALARVSTNTEAEHRICLRSCHGIGSEIWDDEAMTGVDATDAIESAQPQATIDP